MAEKKENFIWTLIKNVFFILILIQIAPALIENIKKHYSKLVSPKAQVGIVPIKGLLFDSSTTTKHLTQFFKDPEIKAIILKIECPGGAAGTSQTLFNEIISLKKNYPKPIISLVENICTSGGYYVACATDHIIAPGTATLGSIGVYMPSFQLKEFIEQFKIFYTPIKTGTYKTITDPLSEKTTQEKELLQALSDDTYNQFITDVAQQRKISITNAKEWADGKLFTARQALPLGLIDELGSASTALTTVKNRALIEGDIEFIHPQQSTWGSLFLGSSDEESSNSLLSSWCQALFECIENRYFKAQL